ncbi:methyltransferase domain-containing protein [Thermobifida fusca]|jgi:23S rRNA (guanine745-N1)-methyltransferase|nr:23S rRNA methyltransferase [Thermobifida fusca]PPS92319.1 23S rRNA methyltransferase [Thermobifida fusca]
MGERQRLRIPDPVAAALACPHCGNGMQQQGTALACRTGHSFDAARQGYVNLTVGRPATTGDDRDMVQARSAFFDAGHYAPLSAVLADHAAQRWTGGLVADIGAGTGHHLAAVLDALPKAYGLAVDVSRYALRRAARAHPRAGAVGCDVWRGLPLAADSVGVLLNVFAPRNGAEFARVVQRGGTLLVVTPGRRHLAELRSHVELIAVDPRKEERLAAQLHRSFTQEADEQFTLPLRLSHAEAATLVGMTPNARHTTSEAVRSRLARLPEPVEVTAVFRLSVYRRR